MDTDDPGPGGRPAGDDSGREERVRLVGERISGVPSRRLGEVLRLSRRKAGRSVADTALRCDLLQRWLLDVEAGRFAADADVVADLLAAYDAELDEVLPPRRPLVPLDGVDQKEVLRRYLAALRRWRGAEAVGPLRASDLEVLSALLGTPAGKLERRLRRLAGRPRPEGRPAISAWLGRRRAR